MKQSSAFEPRSRARRRALQALYQWQITGQEAAEILRQFRAVAFDHECGNQRGHFHIHHSGTVAGPAPVADSNSELGLVCGGHKVFRFETDVDFR